jgi:SpoVK/Ycf46/Vps4 family AAA+-type ATPase
MDTNTALFAFLPMMLTSKASDTDYIKFGITILMAAFVYFDIKGFVTQVINKWYTKKEDKKYPFIKIYGSEHQMTTTFRAVNHYIQNYLMDSQFPFASTIVENQFFDNNMKDLRVITNLEETKLPSGIIVEVSTSAEKKMIGKDDDSEETKKTNIMTITLKESENSETIQKFLDQRVHEFSEKVKNDPNRYIYMYSAKNNPTSFLFNTTKHFDNMFFKQKDILRNAIQTFMNGYEIYEKTGMPYTLGLLFSGEPGTGKTSAIKAIAHEMDRNIVKIPLSSVYNIQDLQSIFHKHARKSLIVFEEIDCQKYSNIFSRNVESPVASPIKKAKPSKNSDDSDDDLKIVKKKSKMEPPFTLGEFLELMDGLIEYPGRIMIMTTNHPEQLDPALLRPGRVDYHITFGKMRVQDIQEMYNIWFDEDIPEDVLDKMNDNVYSQADIGLLFSTHDRDVILTALESNTIYTNNV